MNEELHILGTDFHDVLWGVTVGSHTAGGSCNLDTDDLELLWSLLQEFLGGGH